MIIVTLDKPSLYSIIKKEFFLKKKRRCTMVLWSIVGFIVWAFCIIFILAILKGGRRVR